MSTEKMEPVAWTLSRTLEAAETTTTGYLWFSNPRNSAWTPLYTASQLQAAVAAERERCAKVCESLPSFHQEAPAVFKQCAAAIRQLGDEPEPIRCPELLKNGGTCPHHNLQCGWPACNKEGVK